MKKNAISIALIADIMAPVKVIRLFNDSGSFIFDDFWQNYILQSVLQTLENNIINTGVIAKTQLIENQSSIVRQAI